MKSMIPIIKKELKRYFTDKRLLAALILPGILIYGLYSVMGGVMGNLMGVDENHEFQVHVVNQSNTITMMFEEYDDLDISFTPVTLEQLENSKSLVMNKEVDLIVVYNDSFNNLFNPTETTITEENAEVEIYYNYDNVNSSVIYSVFISTLESINKGIMGSAFEVNNNDKIYDLVDKNSTSSILTMILPMMLMLFLSTGVMAVATESVAGEKERGTIASLLITPVSRFKLAFSKIIAITLPAIMSALISFIGLVTALPKMMQSSGINVGKLSGFEYISLLFIIVITVLLFTVLVTIISTFAKSIKESQQLSNPFMIVVIMAGLMSSFIPNELWVYAIPMLNSAACISNIFSGSFEIMNLIITLLSNVGAVLLGVFLIAKMFNSEKVMFNK